MKVSQSKPECQNQLTWVWLKKCGSKKNGEGFKKKGEGSRKKGCGSKRKGRWSNQTVQGVRKWIGQGQKRSAGCWSSKKKEGLWVRMLTGLCHQKLKNILSQQELHERRTQDEEGGCKRRKRKGNMRNQLSPLALPRNLFQFLSMPLPLVEHGRGCGGSRKKGCG